MKFFVFIFLICKIKILGFLPLSVDYIWDGANMCLNTLNKNKLVKRGGRVVKCL